MVPLYDRNRTRVVPFVTIAIIAVNVLVFAYQIRIVHEGGQKAIEQFFNTHGVRPGCFAAVLAGRKEVVATEVRQTPWRPVRGSQHRIPVSAAACVLPLLTSMFLRAGWAHIGGFVAGAGYMKLLRGGQPPGSGRYVRFRRVV